MDVHTAELEIAKVLAKLELEMDCLIDGVELREIDVTRIDDARQRLAMRVRLNVRRKPGHNWYTGEKV